STTQFDTRSMAQIPAAVAYRRSARSARWARRVRATSSADALLGLLVLDAEVGVRQRLQTGLFDRLAAPVAEAVRPVLDLAEGLVDPFHQVAQVVDQGKVSLPLERGRAGVGVFLVEPHLPRELGLVGPERRLLELLVLGLEVLPLGQELRFQLLDLLL